MPALQYSVYRLYLPAEDMPSLSSCVVREYTPAVLAYLFHLRVYTGVLTKHSYLVFSSQLVHSSSSLCLEPPLLDYRVLPLISVLNPYSLMNFFHPCTKEEHATQVQRFTDEHHEDMEK